MKNASVKTLWAALKDWDTVNDFLRLSTTTEEDCRRMLEMEMGNDKRRLTIRVRILGALSRRRAAREKAEIQA